LQAIRGKKEINDTLKKKKNILFVIDDFYLYMNNRQNQVGMYSFPFDRKKKQKRYLILFCHLLFSWKNQN
jgi:hypothetical protein